MICITVSECPAFHTKCLAVPNGMLLINVQNGVHCSTNIVHCHDDIQYRIQCHIQCHAMSGKLCPTVCSLSSVIRSLDLFNVGFNVMESYRLLGHEAPLCSLFMLSSML